MKNKPADQAFLSKPPSAWRLFVQRFKKNRLAWWSWWGFLGIFALCLGADVIANDKPLVVRYQGDYYFPIFQAYPETTFGGVFETEADYQDPVVQDLIQSQGDFIMPIITFSDQTIHKGFEMSFPAPPNQKNWLGTDDVGRDVLARILYGLRISLLFGMALTAMGVLMGVIIGAIQGYYAGWVDLIGQRVIEVWQALPQLFIMLILASVFRPSLWLLFGVMAMFGWLLVANFVRVEVLKVKNLDYIRACRALGLTDTHIIVRHILPNALTATLSQIPFLLCANIMALTTLDFLGYGLPAGFASLGELMVQGKNNLDAPWIILSAFLSLTGVLTLLIFVGEGLRMAYDPKSAWANEHKLKI